MAVARRHGTLPSPWNVAKPSLCWPPPPPWPSSYVKKDEDLQAEDARVKTSAIEMLHAAAPQGEPDKEVRAPRGCRRMWGPKVGSAALGVHDSKGSPRAQGDLEAQEAGKSGPEGPLAECLTAVGAGAREGAPLTRQLQVASCNLRCPAAPPALCSCGPLAWSSGWAWPGTRPTQAHTTSCACWQQRPPRCWETGRRSAWLGGWVGAWRLQPLRQARPS